jgi:glutamine synthetase
MPGSSLSVAQPNIALNTAVAEELDKIYEVLKDVPDDKMDDAIDKILRDMLIEHKKIIFNGNGYSDEWIKEAEKRGLYNLKSLPDAMPHLLSEKNRACLFMNCFTGFSAVLKT